MSIYMAESITKKAQSQIRLIQAKMISKSGFFFKVHSYTPKQLLLEVDKLESYVGALDENIKNRMSRNKMTGSDYDKITSMVNPLRHELRFLKKEITLRTGTFWESARQPIVRMIVKIGNIFDLIPTGLLSGLTEVVRLIDSRKD